MVTTLKLDIQTPPWALPLLPHRPYKGAKGGRGSGKSWFFAELAVEEMVADPDLRFVCIREVQRTLQFSAKSLVETCIRKHGLEWGPGKPNGLFEIRRELIRRVDGSGLMTFEGMQDHTAESIKSLEGFKRAWVEEAQSISKRSLELLIPTIRADGSEIWFSWNPEQPDDPIEMLFNNLEADTVKPDRYSLVMVNYLDNPFCPQRTIDDAEALKRSDPDSYDHIYLGGFNLKSDSKVLAGKYTTEAFEVPMKLEITRRGERVEVPEWRGPFYGCDHGFAMDPRVLVKCWIGPHERWGPRCLYIEKESYHVKLDIDKTALQWSRDMGWHPTIGPYVSHDDFRRHTVYAESAEPGTNNFLRRNGVPRIKDVKKWQGAIEDGIAHLKSFDKIIIHPDCPNAEREARLYSFKVDKHTGEIKADIEDKHNHIWDAVRYALSDDIKPGPRAAWISR